MKMIFKLEMVRVILFFSDEIKQKISGMLEPSIDAYLVSTKSGIHCINFLLHLLIQITHL